MANLKVRTATGATVEFTGTNTYIRTNAAGVVTTLTCLAWGTAVPLDPAEVNTELVFVVMPLKDASIPVKIVAAKAIKGLPLVFVRVEEVNGEIQVVHRFTYPIHEIVGQVEEVADGKITGLDPAIAKLLMLEPECDDR